MTARARKKEGRIPAAEWVAAAIGAIIVIATVATLVVDLVRSDRSAPDITLHVDSIVASGSLHLVAITARNRGGRTAAALVVEGTVTGDGGRDMERSSATLDFLPSNSARRLALLFVADPRGRLRLRAAGFQEP